MENNEKDYNLSSFIELLRSTNMPLWMLIVGILGSLLTTATNLAIPLLVGNFIDGVSLEFLNAGIITVIITVIVLRVVFSAVSSYLLSKAGQHVVASLREQMWSKMIRMPIPYFDQHASGELVSRIISDTSVVQQVITNYLSQFISGLFTIIGVISLLFAMEWQMTLVMILCIPLMFVVLFPLGRKMGRIARETQDETAAFNGKIQQTLSESRLMKSSTAEATEAETGKEGINRLYQLGLKEAKIVAVIRPLMYIVVMVIMLTIIGYGGLRVANNTMTIGSLVTFLLYLFQIMGPVMIFSNFFTQLQRAAGATNRISNILDLEEEVSQSGATLDISGLSLRFENVSFSYEENEMVLKNISFTAQAGQKVAFAGPNGGGKTTLFSLIERFYEPDAGSILIGNTPIDEIQMKAWRQQIGYVSQDNAMMAGTIRENLTYGLEDAENISNKKLWEVAKMAYADQFIKEFPESLETIVGERGIKLSGGQRQRINIARAFLRNPKLLMLDEATASLDSQSERVVQEALNRLMEGRTTLVIAHRLSTIVDADQIVFIENGRITGKGTHEELVKNHELYRLFAKQQLT